MSGRLIGVVGPSGVGKDSVMDGIVARCPGAALVRRVITRDGALGGEDFDAVSVADFETRAAAGAFCMDWEAHGLRYGIPADVRDQIEAGAVLLVNLSRTVLERVDAAFPRFEVLNITATPETLAQRLAGRGRETPEEIARRLARVVAPFAPDLTVHTIENNGTLDEAVDAALTALALHDHVTG